MKKKVVAVIPARMAASRFPGKPLAKILDLPMIEHIRRRALLCPVLDDVCVATCDTEICTAVTSCGGKAVMTKDTHQRCTDRVEEAAHGIEADIIVILQGDEPLFDARVISFLVAPLLEEEGVCCANIVSPMTQASDFHDQDIVKAALKRNGDIMFFSRAPIPFVRVKHDFPVYRQTGMSAFTRDFLQKFSALAPTPLEITESVDFLRIIEHGFSLRGVVFAQRTIGVDRKEDVAKVEKVLREDTVHREIYRKILELGKA